MKIDKKQRRVRRAIKRWNQKFIRKFKLDVFFNDAHKTPEHKSPTQDPTKSNKQRLIERRLTNGTIGKKR